MYIIKTWPPASGRLSRLFERIIIILFSFLVLLFFLLDARVRLFLRFFSVGLMGVSSPLISGRREFR